MVVASEDVRLLVDVGFIAWSRGLSDQAAKIFEAVRLLRPEQEAGFIGAALVELHRGAPDRAVAMLRKLPPTDCVRAFLGVALSKLGEKDEALEILREVAEHASDPAAGEMARSSIESLAPPDLPAA